jgi:rhamnosyltransferase subunit A
MNFEQRIVPLPGGLKVHVESCLFDPAFDSVILINGALATTASFGQTIKYLSERYNVICFDLPYAGQSKPHNQGDCILTQEDEADILLHLIGLFEPAFLLSVSWGGAASLLALSRAHTSVRRAVIASYSPFPNAAMIDYVTRARDCIVAGDHFEAAQLLNDTVGCYLPRIVKLCNFRYLTMLPPGEVRQVAFHIDEMLALSTERFLHEFANIGCSLKFINGELDDYATPGDVRTLGPYLRHAEFETIAQAGHFLDLEGRHALQRVRESILGFFGEARGHSAGCAGPGFGTVTGGAVEQPNA